MNDHGYFLQNLLSSKYSPFLETTSMVGPEPHFYTMKKGTHVMHICIERKREREKDRHTYLPTPPTVYGIVDYFQPSDYFLKCWSLLWIFMPTLFNQPG